METLLNPVNYLNKVSEKLNFKREMYIEKNIPTTLDNIFVFCFFGDLKDEYVLSSFLIQKIKSLYPNKYFILCSHSGHGGLFPNIDEYWGFDNIDLIKKEFIINQLNRYFDNVKDNYSDYYNRGFTKKFFIDFKDMNQSLPSIPSVKVDFSKSLSQMTNKIFMYPSKTIKGWDQGKEFTYEVKLDFWIDLVQSMLENKINPIIYQNNFTYDLSPKFETKCLYCTEKKMINVLGCIRATGCTLDVFNDISYLSILARTPYISCNDRQRYHNVKLNELNEINNIVNNKIFSFPTLISFGNWNELVVNIIKRIKNFIPSLNEDSYPSTQEQYNNISFAMIKEKKEKKIGLRFIKSNTNLN